MLYVHDQKILLHETSIIVKILFLTNNLCYPRIKKKLIFCETIIAQHLVVNIITCLSDAFILWNLKHLVFWVFW